VTGVDPVIRVRVLICASQICGNNNLKIDATNDIIPNLQFHDGTKSVFVAGLVLNRNIVGDSDQAEETGDQRWPVGVSELIINRECSHVFLILV
jgi:hypothetical protein